MTASVDKRSECGEGSCPPNAAIERQAVALEHLSLARPRVLEAVPAPLKVSTTLSLGNGGTKWYT